jgi:hypothetical protein
LKPELAARRLRAAEVRCRRQIGQAAFETHRRKEALQQKHPIHCGQRSLVRVSALVQMEVFELLR